MLIHANLRLAYVVCRVGKRIASMVNFDVKLRMVLTLNYYVEDANRWLVEILTVE